MKLSDRNDVNAGNTRVLGRALPAGGLRRGGPHCRILRRSTLFQVQIAVA